MSEQIFYLGQKVITVKNHTWRVKGNDYVVEAGTSATIVDFGRYSNDPHIQFKDGVTVTSAPKLIMPLAQDITVNQTFNCTQRELVFDIAQKIYGTMRPNNGKLLLTDVFNKQNPEKFAIIKSAEAVFELFVGYPPSYDDEN
ncbi:MAG: hypothetical protein AAF821_05010 [Cyanobacteria bacterium P01_D01_bin.156]